VSEPLRVSDLRGLLRYPTPIRRNRKRSDLPLYTDSVAAAVAGQGVAIGRFPLSNEHLKDKRLVTPFRGAAVSQRGYYVELASHAAGNTEAQDFVRRLQAEVDSTVGQLSVCPLLLCAISATFLLTNL
jgi:DNA-binding transcriptional LysR family regulator